MQEKIVFDDWSCRIDGCERSRKNTYIVLLIMATILLLLALVCFLIEWPAFVLLILALITFICLLFEFLRMKNNHLVITNTCIYVTNRLGKTRKYTIDYTDTILEIRRPNKRRGAVTLLKFRDANGKLLLKYEDMLNAPAIAGGEITFYGEALRGLGIPIHDPHNMFYE